MLEKIDFTLFYHSSTRVVIADNLSGIINIHKDNKFNQSVLKRMKYFILFILLLLLLLSSLFDIVRS